MTDCPNCATARLRAKAEGHREWRTDFVCYEHAAFDLDSPEGRALMADVTEADVQAACKVMGLAYIAPASADQPDLFSVAA